MRRRSLFTGVKCSDITISARRSRFYNDVLKYNDVTGLWSFLGPFRRARHHQKERCGNRLIAHTPLFGVNNIPIVLRETRPRSHTPGERVKINDERTGQKRFDDFRVYLWCFLQARIEKRLSTAFIYSNRGDCGECFFVCEWKHGGNTSQARRKTSCFIFHSTIILLI